MSSSSGRRDEGAGQKSSARPAPDLPQNSFFDSGALDLNDTADRARADEETETDMCATVLSAIRFLERGPQSSSSPSGDEHDEFCSVLRTLCRNHEELFEKEFVSPSSAGRGGPGAGAADQGGDAFFAKKVCPTARSLFDMAGRPPPSPSDEGFWRFSGGYNLDLSLNGNGFEKCREHSGRVQHTEVQLNNP